MSNTVNVQQLSISRQNALGATALAPDSEEHKGLTHAVHVAVTILNKPKGRAALEKLGFLCVQEWTRITPFRFGGTPELMDLYVEEFIAGVQRAFPLIALSHFASPRTIAQTTRIDPQTQLLNGLPAWNGDLDHFQANQCCHIELCHRMVTSMAAESRNRHLQGVMAPIGGSSAVSSSKWHMWMFTLTQALIHELTHVFVFYLRGNNFSTQSVTPVTVTFPNFGSEWPCSWVGNEPVYRGESGRWMEGELWGGGIVYLGNRDSPNQNEGEPGIAYVLDTNNMARAVDPACLISMFDYTQDFDQFPLATQGEALSLEERNERYIKLR